MNELHHIMGPCNLDDLVKLEGVVDGLKISDPNNKFFCDICCRGKLPHCAVNKKPDVRALKPLDLVHSDLAGPISPVAKDGFEYAICFWDDYSGMVFYYFMKHKSDTTLATAKFIADVAHIGKIKTMVVNTWKAASRICLSTTLLSMSVVPHILHSRMELQNEVGEPVLTWPDVCY